MPIHPISGQCYPFSEIDIADMDIETLGVRDGSHPSETREKVTSTMSREFLVHGEWKYQFCELVLGNTSLFDGGGGDLMLSRLLPDPFYGRHPIYPEIVATKIESMKGHVLIGDDEDGMPEYEKCKINVLYEHVPYTLKEDDETTSEFERYTIQPGNDPSGSETEYTTIPGSIMNYVVEDQSGEVTNPVAPHMSPIPFNIGFITTTQERKFTLVMLPDKAWGPGSALHDRIFSGEDDGDPNHKADRPWLGCINQFDFQGYPMGTLLFDRVEEKKYRSGLGEGFWWDLTFVFRFRPNGWNWLYYFSSTTDVLGPGATSKSGLYFASNGPDHYYAETLPDGKSLYCTRDFDKLAVFGPLDAYAPPSPPAPPLLA